MNKKLVALAVAGAFASPLAVQAQTANVTLYGRANLDLEFVNGLTCPAGGNTTGGAQGNTGTTSNCLVGDAGRAAQSNPTVARVSANSSRFGMRGTESLGGGLNAIFQLESGVFWDTGGGSTTTGTGTIASRESFVGLQGSWGKVYLGNFLMPQDDLGVIFGNAPTLNTSILSTADVWAQGNLTKGQGGFDARPGNNVRYDSPNYQGFTGSLQFSTRDDSGQVLVGDPGNGGSHSAAMRHAYVVGGNVIYANGPIQAGVAFESNTKVRQYTADPFATAGSPGTSAANPFNANDLDWTITGAYDFGTIMQGFGLRLGAVYEHTKYDTPTGGLKRDFWGVSGTVPVGGGKVYAFYGKASNGKGSAADGEAVGYVQHGSQTGTQQWEVSYSYSLSPRTLLYAGYVKILNQRYALTTFNINPYAIVTCTLGSDCRAGSPGGAIFGMVHNF